MEQLNISEWQVFPSDMEKFALLIVQECMDCATWVGKTNTAPVEPIHTAHAINQRMQQQFGVEDPPVNNVDRILRTIRTRS